MYAQNLLDSLENTCKETAQKLRDLAEKLDNGHPLADEQVDEIVKLTGDARVQYGELMDTLSPLMDEPVKQSVTIAAFRKYLNQYQNEEKQHRLEHAKNVVAEFSRLTSDVERYAVPLQEHKNKVSSYLDTCEEDESDIEDIVLPYEVFVRVVQDGVKGEEIETIIAPKFGDVLALAVERKRLYFESADTELELDPPLGPDMEDLSPANPEREESIPQPEAADPIDRYEKDIALTTGISKDEAHDYDLAAYEIELLDDEGFGELQLIEPKKSPRGVKSFIGDVVYNKTREFRSAVQNVGRYLISIPGISIKGLTNSYNDTKVNKALTDVIAYLEREGFINQYYLSGNPDDIMISVTSAGKEVLTSDKMRSMVMHIPKTTNGCSGIKSAADFYRMKTISCFICALHSFCAENNIEEMKYAVLGMNALSLLSVRIDNTELIVFPCTMAASEFDELSEVLEAIREKIEGGSLLLVAGTSNMTRKWGEFLNDYLVDISAESIFGVDVDKSVVTVNQNTTMSLDEWLSDNFIDDGAMDDSDDVNLSSDHNSPETFDAAEVSHEENIADLKPELEPELLKHTATTPNGIAYQSPRQIAADMPPISEVIDIAMGLAAREEWPDLLALTKAFSFTAYSDVFEALHRRILYALDMPWENRSYTGESLRFLDNDIELLSSAVSGKFLTFSFWSIMIRARFSPDLKFDQVLTNKAKQAVSEMKQETAIDTGMLKKVFAYLDEMCEDYPNGFSRRILQMQLNDDARRSEISRIVHAANELLAAPNFNVSMNGAAALRENLFGKFGDMYKCLYIVVHDDKKRRHEVESFFSQFYTDEANAGETLAYNDSKVQTFVNKQWEKVKNSRANELQYKLRKKVDGNLMRRLDTLRDWLLLTSAENTDSEKLKRHISRTKNVLENAITTCKTSQAMDFGTVAGIMLLRQTLKTLNNRLKGVETDEKSKFLPLLCTPYIGLNDGGTPDLERGLEAVSGFEPWRFALKNAKTEKVQPEVALKYIDDREMAEWYSNYGAAKHLERHCVTDAAQRHDYSESISNAENEARKIVKKLRADFEFNYMNGCLEEQTKETALAEISVFTERFIESRDFARFNMFLKVLRERIDSDKKRISEEIQKRRDAISMPYTMSGGDEREAYEAALGAIDDALENGRLAATEDYINRLEAGDASFADEALPALKEAGTLEAFRAAYIELYRECVNNKERDFTTWGNLTMKRIGNKLRPERWAAQHERKAERLLGSWIRSGKKETDQAGTIQNLLREISGIFGTVKLIEKGAGELYEVETNPPPRDHVEYAHPITAFGTGIQRRLKIAVIYGTSSAQQIFSRVVNEMHIEGNAIILVEGALSLAERNKLAGLFKPSVGGAFLLLDRVLMLYLASQYDTEWLSILLRCSLPYTYCQPYVADGGSVSDEMFVGRKAELSDIRNMSGACLVYGGRQLGKTALLLRARSVEHKPGNHAYALYISLDKIGLDEFSGVLRRELKDAGLLEDNCSERMEDIFRALRHSFNNQKIDKLLILCDEADKFLNEDIAADFKILRQFVDLRQQTSNRFKCVFAGLHNVMRASAKAIENNSPLTKLGKPLCIKPLHQLDAQRLVRYPLAFLGFNIGENQLATILSATNYYPGIIHLFCYELLRDVSVQYSNYYGSSGPPFDMRDNVMSGIISSAELNRRVREKIHMTLHLDERYWILANAMAYLCYGDADGELRSYTAFKIYNEVGSIGQLSDLTPSDMEALLDEMCEMGILSVSRISDMSLYRFRKNSFLAMIGSEDSVLDVLMED